MTVKEYLNQAYRVDERISVKLEQIQRLRELATKATTTLSCAGGGGGGDAHSKERIIAKIVDLEQTINADIEHLIDLKAEIAEVIKQVNNKEYQELLELRYLCYKKWEDIASQMGYSTQNIFVLHKKALKKVVWQKD